MSHKRDMLLEKYYTLITDKEIEKTIAEEQESTDIFPNVLLILTLLSRLADEYNIGDDIDIRLVTIDGDINLMLVYQASLNYIYGLIDPADNKPFPLDHTITIEETCKQHMKAYKTLCKQ